MPISNIHSFANPISGFISGSEGLGSTSDRMTYSVGTQMVNPTDYVTKPHDGSDVGVTVVNGVIEFSFPQSHEYIGIGDKVSYYDIDENGVGVTRVVYLSEKISTERWRVLKETVSYSSGFTSAENSVSPNAILVSIDKAFSGLSAAATYICGNSGDLDLVSHRTILQIACYDLGADDIVGQFDIAGMTTSKDSYVRIFTPNNVATECNSSQRHNGEPTSGYSLVWGMGLTATIQSSYTEVDGLVIKNHDVVWAKLNIGTTTSEGIRITNNIFVNGDWVKFTAPASPATGTPVYFVSNIMIGCLLDAKMSRSVIFNNTTDSNIDSLTAGSANIIYNNLLLGAYASILYNTADAANIKNNVAQTDCFTIGSPIDCYGLVTTITKNLAANDYRIDQRAPIVVAGDVDVLVSGGIDLSNNSDYKFSKDICGNKIDDTWHIGAYHYTRELRLAVINPSVMDLNSSAYMVSIVDGILTVNNTFYDSRVCAGCFITADGYADGELVLHEMITPTSWAVTKRGIPQGRSPADYIGSHLLHIVSASSTLSNALSSTVATAAGGSDLTGFDLKTTIYCSYGSETANIVFENLTFDETRNLTITSPVGRRHNGVYDTNLWNLDCATGIGLDMESTDCPFAVIDGLQISAGDCGILTYVNDVVIKNNLIHSASQAGIMTDNLHTYIYQNATIANNIVYDCGDGIRIYDNQSCGAKLMNNYVFVYNNTLVNNQNGVHIEVRDEWPYTMSVELKNNLEQGSSVMGYFSTSHNPLTINAYANWSSDLSIEKFSGKRNRAGMSATFRSNISKDYKINFATSLRMTDVEAIHSDPHYQAVSKNSYKKYDVGAMQFIIEDAFVINYSIGKSNAIINDYSNLYATIVDSVLVFMDSNGDSVDMGLKMGIGDVVTFDGNSVDSAYLGEKGDMCTWIARTPYGSPYPTLTDIVPAVKVISIARVASSIKNAFNDGVFAASLIAASSDTDLVANNANLFAWCYDDADDTDQATIDGFTTDYANTIVVQTPWSTESQCNATQRHIGVAGAGYRIVKATAADNAAIMIDLEYVTVRGFIIDCVNGVGNGIQTSWDSGTMIGGSGCVVDGNVIFNASCGITQDPGGSSGSGSFRNNIVYNSGTGIRIFDCYVANNTVVDCTVIGISFLTNIGAVINNIVDNGTSISAAPCYSDTTAYYFSHCISSDETGPTIEYFGYRNVDMFFVDRLNHNFNLSRKDWVALNNGVDPNGIDPNYFYHDIHMQELGLRGVSDWSIGAASQPNLETLKLYFSVGADNTDFSDGTALKVKIEEGFATFTDPQLSDQFGVGNKITYNTVFTCYVYRRVSRTVCEVRDKWGLVPENSRLVTVNSIMHAYYEIDHACDGPGVASEDPSVAVNLGIGPNGLEHTFYSLENARYQINLPVYKSATAFALPVTLSNVNYEAKANHYFRIYTPTDTTNECNESQRHRGMVDIHNGNKKAIIILDDTDQIAAIRVSVNYTVIEGLIIQPTPSATIPSSYNDGISISTESPDPIAFIRVDGCIITRAKRGIYCMDFSSNEIFINNIIYDCRFEGITTYQGWGLSLIANNTVYNCGEFVSPYAYSIRTVNSDRQYNNIVWSPNPQLSPGNYSAAAGAQLDGGEYITSHCISTDATLDTIPECFINTALLFNNPSERDLRLNQTYAYDALAKDSAKQLTVVSLLSPSDVTYPPIKYSFNYDATGLVRDNRWDRGALEYVPKRVVYAVGNGGPTGDVKTNPLTGSLNFKITQNYNGESIITFYDISEFEVLQTNDLMGVGNEVTDLAGLLSTAGCLIRGKINESNWIVTDRKGEKVDVINNGTVNKIKPPFTTIIQSLNDQESRTVWDFLETKDLLNSNISLDIACYNDGYSNLIESPIVIENVISDMNCRVKIYTPHDINTEVNATQHHYGAASNSFKILSTSAEYAINISYAWHTHIEGLVISAKNGTGIRVVGSGNVEIVGNIIYDCKKQGIDILTEYSDPFANDFIINNLVYNCGEGIKFGSQDSTTNNITTHVLNNTVYNCRPGIHYIAAKLTGYPFDSIKAKILNNICQLSGNADFGIDNSEWAFDYISQPLMYNISSDPTANNYYAYSIGGWDNSCISYGNTIIKFQDPESGNFEIRPEIDYAALDTGKDLTGYEKYAFSTDIKLTPREILMWERGAFESASIQGYGTLEIGDTSIDGLTLATSQSPVLDLYLRKNLTDHLLAFVDPRYQFLSIDTLNTFLGTNAVYDAFNVNVHVEGNQTFVGTLSLRSRGVRDVNISTYINEITRGPAAIEYSSTGLVDNNSLQKHLQFSNMKVMSDASDKADYPLSNLANTHDVTFANCIVQMNRDAFTSNASCIVTAKNSILIFSNDTDSSQLYLTKNSNLGNMVANCAILSYKDADMQFATSIAKKADAVAPKEIYNSLTYNYKSGRALIINNPDAGVNCIISTDPLFDSFSTPYAVEHISANTYFPLMASPLINSGNNDYVITETDIIGKERVFDYGFVDMGPYEVQIKALEFSSKDISFVYQDKLTQNNGRPEYIAANRNIVFASVYNQFDDDTSKRDEFFRESKIIIQLNVPYARYKLYTDKKDVVVREFEAYYDESITSIVVAKDSNFTGDLFSTIFMDDRFLFVFNEATHKLTVYLNDTYDKGASGGKNPIKNVKFGGSSIIVR